MPLGGQGTARSVSAALRAAGHIEEAREALRYEGDKDFVRARDFLLRMRDDLLGRATKDRLDVANSLEQNYGQND